MKKFTNTLCLFFVIATMLPIYAAHIVGGDVVYRCINVDTVLKRTTFDVIFTMYRDSKGGGANFDTGAKFGIFSSTDGFTWKHEQTVVSNPKDIGDVPFDNPCIIVPPNIGVEKGIYQFTTTLSWSGNKRYQIAYQRCCRNGTVNNLISSGTTGAAFFVEIFPEALRSCNNSPVFKKFPPIVICIGEPLKFDHGATDSEGDQLVYEFCAPITAGGTDGQGVGNPEDCTGVRPNPAGCPPPFEEVTFAQPLFSFDNPLGNGSLLIDPNTGIITGAPMIKGQYVVGVCVKEYRNGKLIGTLRRDFQFNVEVCQIAVDANLIPDYSNIPNGYVEISNVGDHFHFKSCGSKTIPILNKSTEERNIKGYLWYVNEGSNKDSFSTKDFKYTFSDYGNYSGKMILNPNLSNCSDTATVTFEILPEAIADYSYDYDTCVAGPIDFTDASSSLAGPIQSWKWNFEDTIKSSDTNPIYEYRTPGLKDVKLTVIDPNQCKGEIIKKVSYFPVPALIVIEPTQFTGCIPAAISFNNLSYPIDSTYKLEWDFGDGKKGDDISPTHVYDSIGLYDVAIQITSPIGCKTSKKYPEWVEILEKPYAAFTYSPTQLNSFQKTTSFTEMSERAKSLLWNFGNRGISFENNPTFTFPDTGFYNVELIVFHENGCTDTALAIIDVSPLINLAMPNAFTPNNDGTNDDFKGFGTLDGVRNFKMSLFNRWGEEIFATNDPSNGWTGEYKGVLSPQGVYVYLVEYVSPRGEPKKLKGSFTLIR